MKKKSINIIFVLFILLFLASCGENTQTNVDTQTNTDENSISPITIETKSKEYQIYLLAQESGYTGTYEEWLASIKGEKGADGQAGKSAYEIAVANGYTGTEAEWLESIKGEKGDPGDTGKSIISVEYVKSLNDYDFYEILFSDGTKYEFKIRNTRNLFFTVTWKNYDGSTLKVDEDVFYGTYLRYVGDKPAKESEDDNYEYIFNGWENVGYEVYVTSDLELTAKYKKVEKYDTIPVVDQKQNEIQSIKILKETYPNLELLELESLPNYIENDKYFVFSEWDYDSYSNIIYPRFNSYDLVDNLYMFNNNIYEVKEENGTIINEKVISIDNSVIVYGYFKDKYGNLYIKNNTFETVDRENRIIYYIGDKYFKSEDGQVICFNYGGTTMDYYGDAFNKNLVSIKKINEYCLEENISLSDEIVINKKTNGGLFIGNISNGYIYISGFSGYAFCKFIKINLETCEFIKQSFGYCEGYWDAGSIYTTNYSSTGMVICVSDDNDYCKLYYIDNIWKYGNFSFYNNIKTDDTLVTQLADNIHITCWDYRKVEYRIITGTTIKNYYIDFDSETYPVVVEKNS